jgi:hypothetical protein
MTQGSDVKQQPDSPEWVLGPTMQLRQDHPLFEAILGIPGGPLPAKGLVRYEWDVQPIGGLEKPTTPIKEST